MASSPATRVVSRNIRFLAARKELPLAHMADAAGVGRTTLWRLLDVNDKGSSDPRLSTLEALADVLDVPVSALLADDPNAATAAEAELQRLRSELAGAQRANDSLRHELRTHRAARPAWEPPRDERPTAPPIPDADALAAGR